MQLAPLFDFLTDLRQHNDRDWFQVHKATYTQLRAAFELDVAYWFQELRRLDPALAGPHSRHGVFRIYRDVRFSTNKDPYKTHFSVYFAAHAGREADAPGYYLQLGPQGQTLVAGGLYMPDKTQLAAIRQEIDYSPAALKNLLAAPDFRRYFGPLGGDRLKKAPAGYPAHHPEIELLKHKGFVATYAIGDADVLRHPDFRASVLDGFRAAVPLVRWLRQTVEDQGATT